MKRLFVYTLILSMSIFQSCKEDFIGQIPTDNVAPGMLSDVQVTNIPGGAVFKYKLPVDEDLLYVEAQYERKGIKYNTKASCFENTLVIEGYADTEEHEVSLFCIDRSNNYSEPIILKIKPEVTPVITIGESLTLAQDIGGVHVVWENTNRASVNILLYAADSLGIMQLADVVYTSVEKGSYYLRGFDDTKRRFAALVKDRWENYSDTISGVFTPRFEQLIPKDGIRKIQLTEDNNENMGSGTWQFYQMFNDIYGVDTDGWHTRTPSTDPEHGAYFTIDWGHKVQLTRYKLWQRGGTWPYMHHNPKVWSLYGRDEDPTLIYKTHYENDIEYWSQGFKADTQNWQYLMKCRTEKPSGFDNLVITPEDLEYANAGHEYIFDENLPPVRYIRFVIDETWAGGVHPTLLHIGELTFYGKIVD